MVSTPGRNSAGCADSGVVPLDVPGAALETWGMEETHAPRWSVIVPFRNAGATLSSCAQAVLAQDLPSDQVELIFVDNASTDGAAAQLAGQPRIRLLSETKPGSYAARNCGMRVARGRFIAFTDSDCIPIPGWLRAFEAAFEDEEVQLCLGSRCYNSSSRALQLLAAYEQQKLAWVLQHGDSRLVFGFTNNLAVRREVFAAEGPFVEVLRGADSAFVNRVHRVYGPRAVHLERQALVRHLEIFQLRQYLAKRSIYGWSNQRMVRHATTCVPLSMEQRFRIFGSTASDVPPEDALLLFSLLAVGGCLYEGARWLARVRDRLDA